MGTPAAVAALAASAMVILGGCQNLVKHQVAIQTTTPTASVNSPISTNSPEDAEAAKTKACHSFAISAKAMSDSQDAFTERHKFINWGDTQVRGEASDLAKNFNVWITSLQDDITPALSGEIKSKLEAYIKTSSAKRDAYIEEKPDDQLAAILKDDNDALHDAGRACGTEK